MQYEYCMCIFILQYEYEYNRIYMTESASQGNQERQRRAGTLAPPLIHLVVNSSDITPFLHFPLCF